MPDRRFYQANRGARLRQIERIGARIMAVAWNEQSVQLGEVKLRLWRGGAGRPVLVLHHDIGTPDRLPFYDALAEPFDVHRAAPSRLSASPSGRMAAPRARHRRRSISGCWPISASSAPSLIGLGFGGWIAAEMATMAPRDFHRLVLVGAMGLKPPEGDIFDQAIVSYIDYARAGFHDQAGVRPDLWRCLDRPAGRLGSVPRDELPHRLEALHVQPDLAASAGRGARAGARRLGRRRQDRAAAAPASVMRALLREARLEIVRDAGHCVEMEQPEAARPPRHARLSSRISEIRPATIRLEGGTPCM